MQPTGLCHTFDAAADGYVKAEGVNAIIVKRLDAAIADRDPIRAIILGSATTSNGRTPGIYSPSAASQAMAIRAAYANANITDLNHTTYLEVNISPYSILHRVYCSELIQILLSVMEQEHRLVIPLKLQLLAPYLQQRVQTISHCWSDL